MGRGRKNGSKNKPKEIKETSLEIKRIKKEIKDLRAEKLSLPAGDIKRIELYRKIKEMKLLLTEKKEIKADKIIEITQSNTEKQPIIDEILRLDELMAKIDIDLTKHSVENLQKYLNKLNGR